MADMTAPAAPASGLDAYFGLSRAGTTVRTEVIAGITTFLTMAYILFVNPQILSAAGMPQGAVFVATCLAAAAGTLVMALYANYPIALAPGMGLNAFFAFFVVGTLKFTWQEALAAVFFSGLIALAISLSGLRQYVINAFPRSLKLATSAGIGLFLAVIALSNAKIVVDHPATLVTLGSLKTPAAILFVVGFVAIVALNKLNVVGGTILGILLVSALGIPLGVASFGGIVSLPPDPTPTLFALSFARVAELTFWVVVISMFFVDFFDTAGTLVGVTHRAGMLDSEGRLERMPRALVADSSGTTIGALLGTSNTTSYVESAAGVAVGGRTGLASVVTAICFLLALFFSPLAGSIPAYATAAALLFVACVMAQGLGEIDWDDISEYAPAVVCAVAMPLTYSIAAGIGLGMITYVLIKALTGRFADLSIPVIALAIVFGIKFGFGLA